MDFRVIYLSFRNFSITYQFFKKSYRGFFEIYQENQQKRGLKIAFYVDVNVFSLSNLATLKADISKTSSERYRFLFIFVCRISKYTHMQKIKKFYREVNYVHLALKSTHNLWFGAKIRRIGIPLHTPILLYKSGVQGGIHYMDMFS